MGTEEWDSAVTLFLAKPDYSAFKQLVETLPFETMCQYLLMDENANEVVTAILPVVTACFRIEEVVRDYVVRPTVIRICQLSDIPIEEPVAPDGTDRFEQTELFTGTLRHWALSERYPDRRGVLRDVLLIMIRITGAVSLCAVDQPELQPGLAKFGEALSGLWLNMLDAADVSVANNMLEILNDVQRPSKHETLRPKEKHFVKEVIELKDFDDCISRWRRGDLTPDELDLVHSWVLNIPEPLLARLRGEATLLGGVEKTTAQIRAAVALIRLMDMTQKLGEEATDDGWVIAIIDNLYFCEDALLKLAASQVIIDELLNSTVGCRILFSTRLLSKIIADLRGADSQPAGRRACLRLLANVFEKVPESRDALISDSIFLSSIQRLLLGRDPALQDPALAISCVGALMSDINPPGVRAVRDNLPEWAATFEKYLITGDEHETSAAVMAIMRMVSGITPRAGSGEGFDATVKDALADRQKLLQTVDTTFTNLLIQHTYPKPFIEVRVMIYRLFEVLMTRWGCFGSVHCYNSSPALMTRLFNCPGDAVHEVVVARWHYIKKVALLYTAASTDKRFSEAIEFCCNHGPYDVPPSFRGVREPEGPVVADEAAQ